MINLKDPKVLHLIETIFWTFLWMIVALAWSNFIDSILVPLQEKIAFLWIIWYLLYAIIITILSIFLITIYINFLNKKDENDKKN